MGEAGSVALWGEPASREGCCPARGQTDTGVADGRSSRGRNPGETPGGFVAGQMGGGSPAVRCPDGVSASRAEPDSRPGFSACGQGLEPGSPARAVDTASGRGGSEWARAPPGF